VTNVNLLFGRKTTPLPDPLQMMFWPVQVGCVRAVKLFICATVQLSAISGYGNPVTENDNKGTLVDQDMTNESVIYLDTIEVTAEKRKQKLEKVPLSITVIDSKDIENAGITFIKDASFLIPNLHLIDFSARRLSFPFIRGIGSGQGNPAVGTHLDDVPQLTVNTFDLDLIDIDRIEFLRGPQGTLYGRNTLGGTINIFTEPPSKRPRLKADSTFGNFGAQRFRLSLSGPIKADRAYLGLSGSFRSRDGYTKNEITGNNLDDKESYYGRAKVVLNPADKWDLQLIIFGERDRDGGFTLFDLNRLKDKPRRAEYDFEGHTERDVIGPSLSIKHHGSALDFTSITAYQRWRGEDLTDADFTSADLNRRRSIEKQHQITQEVRLSSPEGRDYVFTDDLTINWLIGFLYFSSDYEIDAETEYGPLFAFSPLPFVGLDQTDARIEELGVSLFGQTTMTLYDKFDLVVGLRYDYENKDADIRNFTSPASLLLGPPTTERRNDAFDDVTPRFGVNIHWSQNLMCYFSAANGFKAGGYNTKAPAGSVDYNSETSWTYEAGLKSLWFENILRFNASVFYVDWDDMQLSLLDPAHPNNFFIDNAGRSKSAGLELESSLKLTESLDVFAGIGYTDTRFEEFTDPISNVDARGNSLPFAPDYTWNIGLSKSVKISRDVSIYGRAEVFGVGQYDFDAGNTERQDKYHISNFRLGVEVRNGHLEGWVKNAFDETYIPVAFQLPNGSFVGESGTPRTYGISFGVRF
jgi:iron complex outermembrane recepter protein